MKKILLLLFILCPAFLLGQNVTGTVLEDVDGEKKSIPGVNVYWENTTEGTVTDENGRFEINRPSKSYKNLVISYIGYERDTISIDKKDRDIEVVLRFNKELKQVEVVSRGPAAHISRLEIRSVQEITGAELCKAACCNLGESFETNASVDVHYSDAVTGAKQIQLLGLSGIYTQLMIDNVPSLYGLAQPYGLTYIPGTWMSAIQISKGCASVVDGYSSLTGQINTNTIAPDSEQRLALNGLINSMMGYEGNFVGNLKLGKRLSTNLMLHASNSQAMHDDNGDGFLDMPMTTRFNFRNRWKYHVNNSMINFGINGVYEDRKGGQTGFYELADNSNAYGIGIKTKRLEAMLKGGHEFSDITNVAFKSSASYHNQTSFFGHNTYDATEKSVYINTVFQSAFDRYSEHKFSTGLSFYYDDYVEDLHVNMVEGAEASPLGGKLLNDTTLKMTEIVPGAYFEYTLNKPNYPVIIAGLRGDYHNEYGFFMTPRFHVRYTLKDDNVFRASVGKGYRTTHLLSEHTSLLASSKQLVILDDLKMEEAWNYGINYTRYFHINDKDLVINASAYRSHFENQVIVDMDYDYRYVYFYNLDGKSFSNVFQLELNYEFFRGLDVVMAFRYQDVKATELNGQLERTPMVNRYKGLLNLSYGTRLDKWRFDYTLQVNGDQRLPVPSYAASNPDFYDFKDSAPAYCIMNAQITKNFRRWSIYGGAENLTNYKQENPIVSAENPFSEYFDSSRVWGPISGIKLYLGFRYNLD